MFFSLVDADISSKKETTVTYDDLLEQVNSKAESIPQEDSMDLYCDLYFAEVLDYKDNYTKKMKKVYIETPIGDIIDKLTILEIKKKKISKKSHLSQINKEYIS